MKALFGHEYDSFPFEVLSISHLMMLGVFVGGTLFIYYYRGFLRKHDKVSRAFMFSSLFILEAMYHIWLVKNGLWEISFTLPLQLCSLSLILCLLLLVTKGENIFQIVYFIGITGATMAIITPELFLGFPHFRFFQFFITHILIIWVCLYFVVILKYKPTKKGLLASFLFLNGSAGIAFIANKLTGGNYMFLAYKPINGSLLDYLGPYPFYILSLQGAALLLFCLLLIPFTLKSRTMKQLNEH